MFLLTPQKLTRDTRTFLVSYPTFKELVVLRSCKLPGYELCDNVSDEEIYSHSDSEVEVERCSISRTKRLIRDIALCNDFQYFYTQTIFSSSDRYDLKSFKDKILKRFKAIKRSHSNFVYLIIFERHTDGAFHAHGLLGGCDDLVYLNSNNYLSIDILDNIGLNSLSLIRSKVAVSNYITKYITSDIVRTDSGVTYFHSKGLNFPERRPVSFSDFKGKLRLIYEDEFIKKYEVLE